MASLGTFKNTGTGITLSRRGAGVLLNVSYKELEIWAAKNGIDEKKLWKKNYGRAIKNIKGKFTKVVTRAGGVEGVPKFTDFDAFTRELRTARNMTRPMGGVLADKKVIIAKKVGNTQYIGWPDRLAEWAVRFQDGIGDDAEFNNKWNRHQWHMLGIKDIPTVYKSNPRRVIPEPFGIYVQKYLVEWARSSFYKDLARQMAKKRFSAK